jgi:tRNA pseudouridine38-40 synthase
VARTLKLVLEYDGTAYVGWERQKNGLAIQEVLEEAFWTIAGERVVVEGSGRTDAGVHALGQAASVVVERPLDLRKLRLGLNAVLPPDVSVISIDEAEAGFHARKSAKSKLYRYTILNDPARRPLWRHRAYHFPQPLDVSAMDEAARALEGTHDFTAFAREADRKKSCVRTILSAKVRAEPPFVHVELEGTGFLYNMVRIVTGTLIDVGLGKRAPADLARLIAQRSRAESGFTVPAHGLALVVVRYESAPAAPI